MTESTRLISDILEISRDITEQRKNSKFKLLGKIVERSNINKLKHRIEMLKRRNIILDKFILQEFFTYILTTNDGEYRDIQSINLSNDANNTMNVHIIIYPSKYTKTISEIKYNITISNMAGMTISYTALDITGMGYNSTSYTTTDLYYTDNIEFYNRNSYSNNLMMKILNTELLSMLESFLIEKINNN